MKEQVDHHAREEEEGELFPEVKKLISADDLVALGQEMLSKFEELLGAQPRLQVPEEITAAASLD